jgi:basic membrane lipoprotein Med (substrate-binding protein (PBP1-ABC) superfamily)
MKSRLTVFAVILSLALPCCKKASGWKPGITLAKEKVKIGVIHITDPFSEQSGYSYAHQTGIEEMKRNLGLTAGQVLYKTHVDDSESLNVESAIRELIAQGVNIIFATSWGYCYFALRMGILCIKIGNSTALNLHQEWEF